MNVKQYFSTGEFAKLAQISKQTLIFYDRVGIFSPIYKDDKNFRYYSINQFETLDILINLRELGLSLDKIKDYLNNRTPDNSIALLKEESKKVKKKIKELEIIDKKIENKIKIIEEGIEEYDNLEPYIKECKKEFLIMFNVESHEYKVIMMSIINFINYCNEKKVLNTGYSIGAMIRKEDLNKENFNKLTTIYLKVDEKIDDDNLVIKPKGTYACINHKGSYEETYKSYKKLLDFIKDNGYKIIGNSYEDGLIENFSCNTEEELLTEISIEVKKKKIFK